MSPSPLKPSIETAKFTTWLEEKGVVRTRVFPGSIVALEDAQENSKAVRELADDENPALLVDLRAIEILTKAAREHFAGGTRKLVVSKIALLVRSPISVFIGNLYMTLSPPNVPTRLFTNETKALDWCRI